MIEGLGEGDPSLSFPRLLISQVGWSIGKHRRAHGAFYALATGRRQLGSYIHTPTRVEGLRIASAYTFAGVFRVPQAALV